MEVEPAEIPLPLGSDNHPNIVITREKVPEKSSLRHILHERFANGIPEDFIAIVLRQLLRGLSFLNASRQNVRYDDFHSGKIYVSVGRFRTTMKIVLNPDKDFACPAIECRPSTSSTDWIWRLGMLALELAYGSLPNDLCSVSFANNLTRILRVKLTTQAQEKGNKFIRMPELKMLVDDDYTDNLEKKILKGKEIMWSDDDESGERKFSRGFLEVVLTCLHQQNPNPVTPEQILDLPFFRKPVNLEEFN